MSTKFLMGALLLLTPIVSSFAEEASEPPYRVTSPADRVTCFNPGLATSPITTCVIETDVGLVVIDTGLSPSMAKRTRARIESEMGRNDVRWVINTHSHFDHSGGNQVYADAFIIGHENAPAAMQAFYDGREAWIERRHGYLARQETAAAEAPDDPQVAAALEENLHFNQEMIADLRESYRSTPPTLTFADQLTVHAGDLDLQLLYFGRAHTDSDILIHVPGLKVLFTGDLFHDEVLGTASFSRPLEVERWLEVLDLVLSDDSGIDVVIGGHGLLYSREWIEAQRRYLDEVWQAITKAKASGTNFAEFSAELQFDSRFSFIADQIGLPAEDLADQHAAVLQSLWRVGQTSAAEEIGRVSRAFGAEAAIIAWAEFKTDNSFYLDEGEINALGYQLLRTDRKVAEALAVFEMNTQAFPNSWNVWDSFAEAHWWIDDEEGVERNYLKALELNPEAESARRGISQIEGHRLDRAGETRENLKFAAGDSTGLEGPYFDQKPPGTTPRVFAPGIWVAERVNNGWGEAHNLGDTVNSPATNFCPSLSPDGKYLFFATKQDIYWVSTEVIHRLRSR